MHQISNIYFVIKLYMFPGIFCAHHQELSTVGTATGAFHAGRTVDNSWWWAQKMPGNM